MDRRKLRRSETDGFYSVLELKLAPTWMDPRSFIERFLEGRSKNTFPTYDCAFWKLWIHGRELGKTPFQWSELDFVGHLVMLDEMDATSNMFKWMGSIH